MPKQPQCSIVIRCCNEERQIERLLIGISQQTIKDLEILIVDSGSTDSTLDIVKRYPTRVLTIEPANFSFGRSLNLGCEAATGEFLVIASAHVYPTYRDWLERLIAPFKHDRIGLVYGKQRGNDTTKYSENRIFARWFPEKSTAQQDHPFCNNANAAIRRCLWEKYPYDESLTGLEDLDWAARVMADRHQIAYAADAEIIHVHDERYRRIFNRYRREAIALKHIFPEQGFTLAELLKLLPANIASDLYHAWRDEKLRDNAFGIAAFRAMQFFGTYRGFSQHGPVKRKLKTTFYYPNGLERCVPESSWTRQLVDYGTGARRSVHFEERGKGKQGIG